MARFGHFSNGAMAQTKPPSSFPQNARTLFSFLAGNRHFFCAISPILMAHEWRKWKCAIIKSS